jgi:AhpD family alkylhydroperoxidase
MEARMTNPAMVCFAWDHASDPGAAEGHARGWRAPTSQELVHLRASQINGCSICLDMGARTTRKAGETDERLAEVAAWRRACRCRGGGSSATNSIEQFRRSRRRGGFLSMSVIPIATRRGGKLQ